MKSINLLFLFIVLVGCDNVSHKYIYEDELVELEVPLLADVIMKMDTNVLVEPYFGERLVDESDLIQIQIEVVPDRDPKDVRLIYSVLEAEQNTYGGVGLYFDFAEHENYREVKRVFYQEFDEGTYTLCFFYYLYKGGLKIKVRSFYKVEDIEEIERLKNSQDYYFDNFRLKIRK